MESKIRDRLFNAVNLYYIEHSKPTIGENKRDKEKMKKAKEEVEGLIAKILPVTDKERKQRARETFVSLLTLLQNFPDTNIEFNSPAQFPKHLGRATYFVKLLEVIIDETQKREKLIIERNLLQKEKKAFEKAANIIEGELNRLQWFKSGNNSHQALWKDYREYGLSYNGRQLEKNYSFNEFLQDIDQHGQSLIEALKNGNTAKRVHNYLNEIDEELINKDSWLVSSREVISFVIGSLVSNKVPIGPACKKMTEFLFKSGLKNETEYRKEVHKKWETEGTSSLSSKEAQQQATEALAEQIRGIYRRQKRITMHD